MKTAVEYFNQEIKELFNMHQDGEISGKMFHMSRLVALGNAKEMEKEQIIIAEIETLRVIEKYGISSIEPLINELKNQIETFKSE
jgi:hypothetical protein